jgi:predicted methyltransferase
MKLPTISLICFGLGAAAISLGSWAASAPSPLARALADPSRAEQRGADARRHPAELVALADLKLGQRILDLIPGDGYWTRIFSKMVGPKGRVYAVWPQAYAKEATGNVAQLQGLAKHYGNIVVQVQPGPMLTSPEPLDVVWTSDNYHDYNDKFMGKPGSLAFASSAFKALKPGGLFIVIDHSAAAGHGLADTETMHRIERAQVIREATTTGFRLVGESKALLNSTDPLDIPVFDPKVRFHTSQFALKFRKPAR